MVCVGEVIWDHQKIQKTPIFLVISKRPDNVHVVFKYGRLKIPTPYHLYHRVEYELVHGKYNSIKPPLSFLGIPVQLLSEMKGFVQYAIIIDKHWTIYTYVALVLKQSTTYILYNSPHFGEEIPPLCRVSKILLNFPSYSWGF